MKTLLVSSLAVLTLAAPSIGQQDHDMHGGHHSPYADQEASGIAALSRQELDDLLAGAGMGMARAAELHQYPGPKHVLELSGELELTDEQQVKVDAIRAEMSMRAKELGEEIVEMERHLDQRFTHRHIDEATLLETTGEIARLYGELRFAHLRAHLATRDVMSGAQIENYDRLRGYSGP